jgi:hypothetical protein
MNNLCGQFAVKACDIIIYSNRCGLNISAVGCFFSCLTDKRWPDDLVTLLDFLKVIITAIVCLAPVIVC